VNDSNLDRERLADLLERGRLSPRQRAAAGDTLARLGDPRPGVLTLDDTAFCLVPPGSFWMGSPDEDEMAFDAEKPLRRVKVSYAYWMARYPVTVAQFDVFVRAGGYGERSYWTEAQAAGVWQANGNVKGGGDNEPRDRPFDFGAPYNLPNHPVVGVTWYEALAFARWLSERWRSEGVLPFPWHVRLPSETEWEKAARGGVEIPARPALGRGWAEPVELSLQANAEPKRRYPWGNRASLSRANYKREIGASSAVGCFPGGASPYGALDLSGNVWEWCMTRWQSNYEDYRDNDNPRGASHRALRGGAFGSSQLGVRCASRGRYDPHDRYDYVGFRVLCAQSSERNRL
jgi:formylglycine-generating enzyme required for sulfatase activity